MKHLYRAGLLLAALIVVAFVIPRIAPIPASIVNYGFHKVNRTDSAQQWASLPVSYAESFQCQSCHPTEYSQWTQSNHKVVACENCHGPAEAHIANPTTNLPIVDRTRDLCGGCHAKLAARPADFPQVDMSVMGGTAPCVTCHNPHDPRAGKPPKVPHSIAGLTVSDCKSCHVPHQGIEQVAPPVPHTLDGRSDCLACHGPNSPSQPIAPPNIPHTLDGATNCLQCHAPGAYKPFPADHAGRTNDMCQTCHHPAATPTPTTTAGSK